MAKDAENHTLALLQKMREGFDSIDDRLETLETQMGGVGGMLALIHGEQLDHDQRIEALEKLKGE